MGGIDNDLQRLVDEGRTPGLQYACLDSSGELRTYAVGGADLRQQRPMTSGTALMAYSMSKIVTAQAIVMLKRQGHLGFDDQLGRYLPGLPYRQGITIRHLLEHRSGIPNPIPLRWVHPAADHPGFDENAALDAVLRRYSGLRFSPGTRTAYSNIGYWLLGRLVERISHQPFVSFVEDQVLRPWHIAPSEISYRFPSDGSQARGYLERYSLLNLARPFITDHWVAGERIGRWVSITDHYVNGNAFGGCIGTALGFCKFVRRVLDSDDASFGWHQGTNFVQKEGGGAGFHSMLRLYPAAKRASVIMSNATALDVSTSLNRLDKIPRSE